MSPAAPLRALLAELFIGVALAAGAYALFVDPQDRRLAHARAQADALEAQLRAGVQTPAMADLARRELEQVARAARAVEHAGEPARTEAALFAAVATLARAHGVRIDALQPAPPPARPPTAPNTAPNTTPNANVPTVTLPVQRLACTLTAVAPFDDAVRFLDDFARASGLTSIRSVRLGPTSEPGQTTVHLTIQSEHARFGVEPVLRAAAAEDRP